MPSWPARLLINSSATSPSTSTPCAGESSNKISQSQIINGGVAYPDGGLLLQHSPHSPATPSGSRATRPNSRHGRSISHPFPSLFSPTKKANRFEREPDILDLTDDDLAITSQSLPSSKASKSGHGQTEQDTNKNLASGRCMTCNRLVRWPGDVKIFRCSICAMINDTEPLVLAQVERGCSADGSVGKGDTSCGVPKQGIPRLSVEKTHAIIDRCLTSYLQARRCSRDIHAQGSLRTPPQSPFVESFSDVPREARDQLAAKPLSMDPEVYSPQNTGINPLHLPYPPPKRSDSGRRFSSSRSQLETGSTIYSSPSSKEICSPVRNTRWTGVGAPVLKEPVRPILEERNGSEGGSEAASPGLNKTLDGSLRLNKSLPDPAMQDRPRPPTRQHTNHIFKPLENYLVASFSCSECLNSSFTPRRPGAPPRAASEGTTQAFHIKSRSQNEDCDPMNNMASLPNLDAKTLLLGDFAENGSWWTGGRIDRPGSEGRAHTRGSSCEGRGIVRDTISTRSPRINWAEVHDWYQAILEVGVSWRSKWHDLEIAGGQEAARPEVTAKDLTTMLQDIDEQIANSRAYMQRILLKVTESLLKRPGRPLKHPNDVRFLLILLANPLLYPGNQYWLSTRNSSPRTNGISMRRDLSGDGSKYRPGYPGLDISPGRARQGPGQHSGIIKRILGLLSNLPNDCHHYLISCFSRFSELQFRRIVDLIGSFVTYRLSRQAGNPRCSKRNPTPSLIPNFSGPGPSTSAQLHAALGISGAHKKALDGKAAPVVYAEDWQIKAAARTMSLLFAANNNGQTRRVELSNLPSLDAALPSPGLAARRRAYTHGQVLPTSNFYNTLLDYSDLVADFEVWESQRGKFSFCQYPFFLSIGAKIRVMEHDARRQMEIKAREAFFNSIVQRNSISQYLVLKVRRDCLVEDSLREVSEVVGTGQEEIKKGLRIEFIGEEGIDAGGPRKEWFLLLVRDIFDPNHGKIVTLSIDQLVLIHELGLFIYDEDSRYCYFNPNCFETSDQFFLVGVLLGLAIYNSTILDVALPPFAFKKLLASAPSSVSPITPSIRPVMGYTLEDLAEFRPSLANGLRQLLDFEGDVEDTYCREFVAEIDRYGQVIHVPLCPGGERRPVTNENRREFVDLYIRYLLDASVARQFEPFKRGFYTVCSGNALSLFRPEEIELLIRGSDEPLDVSSLRAVAAYDNWGCASPVDTVPIIQWFWDFFEGLVPRDQRKMLSFITGSDRLPAMGAANLTIKIKSIGEDCERFPIARTCFNSLGLYRYSSREKLEIKLWRAVAESEGFGLR
ncbi:MAG: putative E3 ubiquitin-protein ligase [Candelina mexicana]|nr:MAG: putative E3 ubiquitin-protein ligase [Candelina mexicana]